MRLELCGGIASGKTTLATALGSIGFFPVLESFEQNPFFESFYRDPATFSFETEITYLLQHYSGININSKYKIASDFSLALDLADAQVTLSSADRRTFEVVLDRIIEKSGLPSAIIRLRCRSVTALSRIRMRNRKAEQSLSIAFLDRLDASISEALNDSRFSHVPRFDIDTDSLDFRPGIGSENNVVQRILSFLGDMNLE
jgi:deoxyadenosine/deoxycytidine kinase